MSATKLVPIQDAPDRWGPPLRRWREWRAQRLLEFVVIGRRLYLDPDAVEAFFDAHREPSLTRNDRPAGRPTDSFTSTATAATAKARHG